MREPARLLASAVRGSACCKASRVRMSLQGLREQFITNDQEFRPPAGASPKVPAFFSSSTASRSTARARSAFPRTSSRWRAEARGTTVKTRWSRAGAPPQYCGLDSRVTRWPERLSRNRKGPVPTGRASPPSGTTMEGPTMAIGGWARISRNPGMGSRSTICSVWESNALTCRRTGVAPPSRQRKKVVRPRRGPGSEKRPSELAASAAVNGFPSWKRTSRRRCSTHSRPLPELFQDTARAGRTWPGSGPGRTSVSKRHDRTLHEVRSITSPGSSP